MHGRQSGVVRPAAFACRAYSIGAHPLLEVSSGDTQRLDAGNVIPDCLRRVPQINRALGVEPELGELPNSLPRRSAISGLTARRSRSSSLTDCRDTPMAWRARPR